MIVIATGFIPLSSLYVVSTMVIRESSQWLERKLKELKKSMNWCTDHRDITEILLKVVSNTIQSINQRTVRSDCTYVLAYLVPHTTQN